MAQYGRLTDVSPGPVEGSYRFTDMSGSERIFAGPDAERAAKAIEKLKAQEMAQATAAAPTQSAPGSRSVRIDRTGPEGPPPTATDAPAPIPGAAGVGGAPGFEPVGTPGGFGGQVPSDFSKAPPGAAQAPAVPLGTEGPPASIARQPEGGTGAAQPTPRLSDGKGGYFVDDGKGGWLHWTPPRAGSKGGLLEKTRTVSGGFETDPEYEQRKAQRAVAEIGVGQEHANQQLALSEHLRAAAVAEMEAQQQAAEQQRLQIEYQNRRVAEAESRHAQALQRFESDSVKPEFSAIEQVIGALSAAAGAFGAGLTGGENFGLSLVKASVAERVRQEESELALKREEADNALAKLTRETGSLDLAKRSLEGILLKQSENKWRSIAALEQDINLRAKAEKEALALAGAYDDWLNGYRQAAGGEVTRNMQYVAPTAGSAGGFGLTTIEQAEKLAGLTGKEAANTGAALGNVKTARELEQTAAGVPKDEAAKNLLGSYRSLDAMSQMLSANAARGDGKPWTPEGQTLFGQGVRGFVDFFGGDNTYKEMLSDATRSRSDTFGTLRQALVSIGTQLTGAGAPSEGEAIRSAAASAQSEEQLINVIRTYKPVIAEKMTAYGVNVPKAPGLKEE